MRAWGGAFNVRPANTRSPGVGLLAFARHLAKSCFALRRPWVWQSRNPAHPRVGVLPSRGFELFPRAGLRSAVHLSRGGMVRMYRGWGGTASREVSLERAGKDVSTGVRSRIESRGINVDCLAPGEVLCARQQLAGKELSRDILLAGGAPQAWRRVRAEHRFCVHGGAARLSPRRGGAPGPGQSIFGVLPRWV